jgi:hypothetical protein
LAQHPELTRALEKPAGESFLAGYSTSLRHESRTSEFPSASKQPSYMMDGMTDRPTKISFGEMRDSGVPDQERLALLLDLPKLGDELLDDVIGTRF